MKLNWANRITILRVLLIAPFVILMLKTNDDTLTQNSSDLFRYFATAIFVLMAISDGIDGYLARKKGQATKLGSFLDPMADKILMTCALLLLSSKRAGVGGFILPISVVVTIIGKDLFLLMGFIIVYFVTEQIKIEPVFIGKISTTLQLVMVSSILLAPEISTVLQMWIWVLRVLWWAAAVSAILTTLLYVWRGTRQVAEYEANLEARSKSE
ncbi:MAG: CDP-alcohol phosphatidyltransferase family protein [Phycisphaerae bacterium]|nr:CDP-alcohol phosphatidyltransferase family protein [Phycisphaerae bacterium]